MIMTHEFDTPLGILWDLDNTLYQATQAVHDSFNTATARAALSLGVNMSFEDAVKCSYESFQKHRYSGADFIRDYNIPFHEMHHTIDRFVDTTLVTYCRETCDLFQHHDGLDHALITHASRTWALQILKNIGIDRWFPEDRVFGYETYDFESKARSRRPFEMALAAVNLNPEDCVMVEDTIENLKVPYEMGITTVFLHHGELPRAMPDYVDYSFENALVLLRTLQPKVYSKASL